MRFCSARIHFSLSSVCCISNARDITFTNLTGSQEGVQSVGALEGPRRWPTAPSTGIPERYPHPCCSRKQLSRVAYHEVKAWRWLAKRGYVQFLRLARRVQRERQSRRII